MRGTVIDRGLRPACAADATCPGYALNPLRPEEREALRDFWLFYEPRAASVHEELLLACRDMPEWGAIVRARTPERIAEQHARALALLRAAVLEDDWQPCLDELRRQGMQRAKGGTTFSAWVALLAQFRRSVRRRLDALAQEDSVLAKRICDALDRVNDLVIEHVGEAYLATQDAVVDDKPSAPRVLPGQGLRATDTLYRQFVERTHEGIVTTDTDGRYTFVNRRLEEMLGYEPGELLGRHYRVILSEDNLALGTRHFEHRRQGISGRGELNLIRKDGSDLWVMYASSPLVDDGGRFCGAFGVMMDITETRRANGALRDQTALYEALLRAQSEIGDGVAVIDGERFVYVNEALARMYGYTVEELLALPSFFAVVAPEQRTVLADLRQSRGVTDPARERRETVIVRKDGRRITIEYVQMEFRRGGRIQTFSIVRDVTAHKQMQARAVIADRMASVGTLAAGVAHEINTPLAYVTANLDMIAEEIRSMRHECPPARVRELDMMVDDARQGAERVRKIVRGLRAFSRSDEERRVLLDVRTVLELSANMTFNEIKHRARLVKDFSEVSPVVADETRLGQVFVNLLVNAAQAIPEGHADGNEVRIVTRMDPSGRVVVEVHDTGRGIPAGTLSRIFEPFFTTKDIGQGTGLGLSICHGIVEGLGGEISVESVVGEGSTFRVALPSAPLEPVEPEREKPVATARPAAKKGRVLVIDDDPKIGSAMRRALQAENEVMVVTDGRQAIDLVRGGEGFDVILCDLMMPQMTGMDVHAELSRVAPDMVERIVFMTGGAFTPSARSFLDTVPNQRLEKPFVTQNLRAVVRGFVR
jgi:two-component system cell cycle sensor histidine kinase/response regulator CckA